MGQKNDFEEPPGESIHLGGSISQRVQILLSIRRRGHLSLQRKWRFSWCMTSKMAGPVWDSKYGAQRPIERQPVIEGRGAR